MDIGTRWWDFCSGGVAEGGGLLIGGAEQLDTGGGGWGWGGEGYG